MPPETSDRPQSELELLGNQSRLEAFFLQSPDGFFFMMLDCPIQWDDSVDKETLLDYVFVHQRVTKVNAAMLAQYCATEKDFIGLTPTDFFAHDLKTGRQLWREMFDRGRLHVETFENRLDGTSMWIEGDYSCLYDSDGRLIGHFGIQRDISKRKQDEEELKQINTALSHAVEGISRLDVQGHYQMVNQAYASAVGYQPEEMMGMEWPKTVHPDDLDRLMAAYQEMLTTGKAKVEARGIRKDGSIFYKQLTMVAIYDPQQQLTGHYCFMKDVSESVQHEAERNAAEAELRKSEQKFRAIFDSMFQFIGVLTPEGVLVEGNQTAFAAVAAERTDVIGKPFWETPWWSHSPPLQEKLKVAIAKAASGELVRFECEHILADGSTAIIDFSLKPIFDEAGKVIMLIPEGRDISERKQTLAALQESEERLQALIDNAGSVIYIKNLEGKYILINDQYETSFHLDREAVKGKTDHDIFPKDIADTFRANDLAAIAAGVPIESEEVAPQGDGLHTYLSVKFPLFDSEGQISSVCGISTDISDRKTVELQLRQQEAFLKSIYDGTEQAIFVVDIAEDGALHYTNFNPVSEQYAGVTNDYIYGKTPEEAFGEAVGSKIRQNYEHCLKSGTSIVYEEQLNFEARIIWTLTTLAPLRDDQGQIYRIIGTATDITDRKTAELELQQQKQDLARSNDELQQFAYVASHDLQEPLRMITSYLELLERRYKGKLDAKADQFIGYAVDGAARMQILIDDLLQYSRVGSRTYSFAQVDCAIVLQHVLRNLQIAIAESNAIITYDALPEVNADITRLTQLFQNLIGNAIKFRREEPPQIQIGVKRTNGKWWLFSVKDNGIGIESQYADRIFVIFQRLHSRTAYPGTGIGLAICKKIVERHGGTLWVESTPNKGSTFYFTLPVLGVCAS
jgi:PAS domain S-box-containing protein